MSTRIWMGAALAAGVAMAASPASAHDPWEFTNGGNDSSFSRLSIGNGAAQVHDLDQTGGANDVDWIAVPTLARHSYEARISNTSVNFDFGACPGCAQFERVSSTGTILTEDVATVNEGSGSTLEPYDRSVRWIASSNTVQEFIRVTAGTGVTEDPNWVYTLRFWDTTYSIPRWNQSGTQTTVILITNLTQAPAQVTVHFYSSTGALLASNTVSVAQNGLSVLGTASIPALSGQSGHAHVVHTAGYGGLAGKAVALESSTGFTFDTAMIPIE